jgi:hypothetical protein
MRRGVEMEEISDEMWLRLRKKHIFPALPKPKLGEKTRSGNIVEIEMMDSRTKEIVINPAGIQLFFKGLSEEVACEAVLDHAILHHTFCPRTLDEDLYLYAEAKSAVREKNKKKVKGIWKQFKDIVVNLRGVKYLNTKIPDLYRVMPKSEFEEMICSFYQDVWNTDLGVSGYKKQVRQLKLIPWLDKRMWGLAIKRFAKIVEDEIQEDEEPPLGKDGLEGYTDDEIKQGLEDFANRIKNPRKFREILQDFESELKEAGVRFEKEGEEKGSPSMGRGKGRGVNADVLFYQSLARKYALRVEGVPIKKDGSLYPYSHTQWEITDPVLEADLWTSFGKIIPGVTQKWVMKESTGFGDNENVPNLSIYIDSSASMTDPRNTVSYAVLGGFCAANAYLARGASVGVYVFADAEEGDELIQKHTKDRNKIFKAITKYFSGGGTAPSISSMEELRKDDTDILMITDTRITNVEDVIKWFRRIENRVTAIHIGESEYTEKFKKALEDRPNISVYGVKSERDIPAIVLGKIKSRFEI